MNAILIRDVLDAKLSWNYQSGKAETHASGDGGAAVDYPSVKDNLQILAATFDYQLRENVRVTTEYRFESFDGSDFQADDEPPFSTNFGGAANGLFLRNNVDDYDAHIFLMSVAYEF